MSTFGFYQIKRSTGWIEVICGSMFSGKTEELIRRVRRAQIAKQQVQVFKPEMDDRYRAELVNSHNGGQIEAIRARLASDVLAMVSEDVHVVALDEVQFFDDAIVEACQALADAGKRVICTGLDLDFRGEPFGFMPRLITMAEEVEKLTAICMTCGAPGTRTQRLVDGRPAHYEEAVILIGAAEAYEPRCRACHVVPGKPTLEGRPPFVAAAISLPSFKGP
ncbi:MAG: thymidine kinase [Candidatus Sericytochromatia bacterium]|nr:thymidine kinase [Candidatus Sericytochromatia bacterium]